jgi:hypothetical protein
MATDIIPTASCKKIGLVSIVVGLVAGVGSLTFGFTYHLQQASSSSRVLGQKRLRYHPWLHYDLAGWEHPKIAPHFDGTTFPLHRRPAFGRYRRAFSVSNPRRQVF